MSSHIHCPSLERGTASLAGTHDLAGIQGWSSSPYTSQISHHLLKPHSCFSILLLFWTKVTNSLLLLFRLAFTNANLTVNGEEA